MAKTPSKSEAAANAYQYSPQDPNVLYDKVSRLEQGMQQILTVVGTGPKIAAYFTSQSVCNQQMKNWDTYKNKFVS